jgi:hypothetical protein
MTRLGESAKTTLTNLRSAFEGAVTKDGGVAVPAAPMESCTSPLRVRWVTFGRADMPDDDESHHPAPAPLLLAVRATVNWPRRHGQQLLSCDEHPGIEDDVDLNVLAIKQRHRDAQDRSLRPQTWEVLAAGLGKLRDETNSRAAARRSAL